MVTIFIKWVLRGYALVLLGLLAGHVAQAQGPGFEWAVTCGVGSQDKSSGAPVKLVVDAQGNTYVTGAFVGTVTIGTTTLTSNGSSDILVAKLDAQGQYLWVATAGGTSYEGGTCIALDGAGGPANPAAGARVMAWLATPEVVGQASRSLAFCLDF